MNEVHRSIPEHKSLETTLERKFKNSFFCHSSWQKIVLFIFATSCAHR